MGKGFTLIELLVVIAVLGVLAAGVFTAINPLQRIRDARDSQRKAAIGQLANALEAYAVSHLGQYPTSSTNWMQDLIDSGDLKQKIPEIPNALGECTPDGTNIFSVNKFCYYRNATSNVMQVWTKAESMGKCSGSGTLIGYVTKDPATGTPTLCRRCSATVYDAACEN